MQTICRLERYNGPCEASRYLVEEMLKTDSVAWFSEFVTALQRAGIYFLCV